MGKHRMTLAAILALALAAVVLIVQLPTKLGLDLRGGTQLTLQVEPTATARVISDRDLEAVQRVIENRVNGLGVSEAVVQPAPPDKLLIQLPGVSDPAQAERVLGGTAQLEFRAQQPGSEGQLQAVDQIVQQQQLQLDALLAEETSDPAAIAQLQTELQTSRETLLDLFEDSQLGGDELVDARAEPFGTGWRVAIAFNQAGGDTFAELTKTLAGTGRSLGIFLDDQLISGPTVDVSNAETGITGGRAVITGNFTAETAKELEIQLRGGALPYPVDVVEKRTVGATLGRDSIARSLYAGVAGLALVLVFMAVYYRLPGILADIALVVYALLTWAVYNAVGVTMTLPGIAGFILSIGMAVDGNVLIFERTREELRSGKTLYRSVEAGFTRAFSSIFDSGITTLIACAALFFFGVGLVKGFALTLGIGVAVSIFTAFFCSRTLLFFTIGFPQFRQPSYFSPGLNKQAPPAA